MAIGDIIVGIDIGSSKVSLVVGEVNNFNQVELVYAVEHKCKGIKKTAAGQHWKFYNDYLNENNINHDNTVPN